MSDPRPIAITGSTGRLGGIVARRLSEVGATQRLLVRDLGRVPDLPAATAVEASYGDRGAVVAALEGVEVVLMVSAHEGPERLDQHVTFVDAAAEAGVEHLVYTSFVGAASDSTFTLARDHWATEEHIRASGLHHTFLRDNLYLDDLSHFAGDDGVIRGPAGTGRVAGVAVADIADAAVAVLLDPGAHVDRTYDLTGGEALSMDGVAEVITRVTGRTVSFHDETIDEAYASRAAAYGAPDWQLDAWVSTYTAIANGDLAAVSADVEALTGHPPATLTDVLRGDSR